MASGGALIAVDARSDRVIGSSRYGGYDAATSEIEVGWTFLARSHWDGVVNAELKRLMLHHAFGFVDRVVLKIGAQNFRSQRAAQKIGAARVGTAPRPDGGENVIYEVTAATLRV